jgi:predicted aspartyl protease
LLPCAELAHFNSKYLGYHGSKLDLAKIIYFIPFSLLFMKILMNGVSKMERIFGSNYLHPVIISSIVSSMLLILRYNDTTLTPWPWCALTFIGEEQKASPLPS